MEDGEGGPPKVPEWLPQGWTVKVTTRQSGKVDRYYVSPLSEHKFRSRAEVMRYLDVKKVDDLPPVTTACSEEDKPCVTECSEEDKTCDVEQAKTSPIWLPSGWITESRTGKIGKSAGRKYKCYIDPSTGSSFYSKAEVFRYLKTGESSNSTSKRKKLHDAEPKEKHPCNSASNQKSINSDSKDNILTIIETSVDGLPPGWIKKVVCKKNASGVTVRKDPYYIDPVSGYVFRSKKDALRYIENGEISRHVIKPKTKGSANKLYSMENESPPPLSGKKLKGQEGQGSQVKRRLSEGKVRKSGRNTTKDNNELLKDTSSSATNWSLFQCGQTAGPSYEAPSDAMFVKDELVKAINQTNLRENELPDKPLEAAEEAALDEVIEKLLDSVSKSSYGGPDGKKTDPVSENLRNPSNMEWSVVKQANKIKSQSSEPVDSPVELMPKKQLEFGGTKAEMTAKQKSMESVETLCDVRMEPSKEKLQEVGVNKKMADQNGKLSGTGEKLIRGSLSEPHEMSNGKISGQGIVESKEDGNHGAIVSPRPHKSKAKSVKSALTARRASKRLAGLEADPAADIEVSDKSLTRGRPSCQSKPSSATIPLDDNQEAKAEMPKPKEESLIEQVETETPKLKEAALGEQVGVEEQGRDDGTADNDLERTMTSPFGDSWPDPCIEFAFKTLTGDFPVLDTATIQDFLHEQLSSVQTPCPDVPPSSVGECPSVPVEVEADAEVQVNSAGTDGSLPGNSMSPQTRGRVKRLCRRSISKQNSGRW